MIEIDGSHGEGGGQILRTAISLSAVTGKEVQISNIRAGRPNPGISPSHVTSIEAVAELCDAEVDGLFAGSTKIVFKPDQLTGGAFDFDVGTAGSISLVVQSCLLPAAMSKSRVNLVVKGGTDVKWSPPIDFMRLVHLPILTRFGPLCNLEIDSRGFYPEGGGEVSVEVSPVTRLSGLDLGERGDVLSIDGCAYAQNLPEHVTSRMRHSVQKNMLDFRNIRIDSDIRQGRSTGAGIVLAATCENSIIGESALGAKGVKSEVLGDDCSSDLKETLLSGASVDQHMLDQILPYMALAEGKSRVLAEELTSHAETNIWVIEKFVGKRFSVKEKKGLTEISIA
jgi:RNA 3'-phosphate cyclase